MSRAGLIGAALLAAVAVTAQDAPTEFEKRFAAIRSRPEYRHSRFGVEFYSMEEGKVIYAWNPQELFIPGSTTKLLSVGTALELLGSEFRFHTKVYRTGPVQQGTLDGNLILVASGDPDLSNRIQSDGTLTFENEDHSYDGESEAKALPGDPLLVVREIANQIVRAGVRRVNGRAIVDTSLFPEGEKELGTGVVISPIVVNDNLVDVTVSPGLLEGERATLAVSPKTRYVKIVSDVRTGPATGPMNLHWISDSTNADGTHLAMLAGTIPAGAVPKLKVYKVPTPSRFAEVVLTEALERAGVPVAGDKRVKSAGSSGLYTKEYQVAEHVSPALREEARVTLKVSQNLHASMMPSIVGAYLKKSDNPRQTGFDLERVMLERAHLDLTGAVQNDGAGGDALFAPDFMVRFLLHLHGQPFFPDLHRALPILGVDGTLFNIEVGTAAAGHVFAKTGTYGSGNALSSTGGVIEGKGLAGFVETKDGRHLAFAVYINFVPLATMDEAATRTVGMAVGEIAGAAYDGFGPAAARNVASVPQL